MTGSSGAFSTKKIRCQADTILMGAQTGLTGIPSRQGLPTGKPHCTARSVAVSTFQNHDGVGLRDIGDVLLNIGDTDNDVSSVVLQVDHIRRRRRPLQPLLSRRIGPGPGMQVVVVQLHRWIGPPNKLSPRHAHAGILR